MRGIWKQAAVVCLILPLVLIASQTKPQPEECLLDVFEEIGVQPEKFVWHHGNRTERAMSKEEVKQWAGELGKAFGIGPVITDEGPDGIRFTAQGSAGRNILIKMVVINDEPSKKRIHPYLAIQLFANGEPGENWLVVRDKATRVLLDHGIVPSYHYSVQGSKQADIKNHEHLLAQVFQLLKAKEVEAMRTGHIISISAFSPLMPEGIETKGGMMNMQAAIRTSSDAHRMTLTLGTPIITIEY
ncbi:YwmB family TATA-box binding protein [Thermoactinomyces mirandus]|uniref:YwmB family TATA-box binding protein n=1 Tax=Thermoactinomyces mirandus TaxID=2756294 RepID=A0A7W2ASY6_9BACL|nr:YwmB family TATA-box binding protein [Thermoactinomyces mirandus]MBA4602976.1 YwmB family TATA-box binding protein [Thermoactinomyces mirandus]